MKITILVLWFNCGSIDHIIVQSPEACAQGLALAKAADKSIHGYCMSQGRE